jgi:hypothetical protein
MTVVTDCGLTHLTDVRSQERKGSRAGIRYAERHAVSLGILKDLVSFAGWKTVKPIENQDKRAGCWQHEIGTE